MQARWAFSEEILDMTGWIVGGVIVVLILYVITIYNGLVKNRQMAKEGWSGIDVQLKRRADLIPNLVEAVKGYAGHESETLEAVTKLRTAAAAVPEGDIAGRAKAEGLLSAALGKLIAVAENYPDLKASANFLDLQGQLGHIESELQMARRYYNGSARILNISVGTFPANLIAKNFGFVEVPYFEIDDPADRQLPKVSF
jgi:LemA protein